MSPPIDPTEIQAPTSIRFTLLHYSGTTLPTGAVRAVALFNDLDLTEASEGQTYSFGSANPWFATFAALLTDGKPGFVAESSTYDPEPIFSGECDYFRPGGAPCSGSGGSRPDFGGYATLDRVDLLIESVDLSYFEDSRLECLHGFNIPCLQLEWAGYRGNVEGTLRWYGTVIPEPGTAIQLALGLVVIAVARRRR